MLKTNWAFWYTSLQCGFFLIRECIEARVRNFSVLLSTTLYGHFFYTLNYSISPVKTLIKIS